MLSRKERLSQLINKYTSYKKEGRLDLTSEETMRTWINELLAIFNWDVMDTSQILQEKILSKEEKAKLKEINSTSTRPDYSFKMGNQKLTFLDAKALNVNIKSSKKSAFQIKSYGWSISAPCAFLTNFEEFAIYDCSYIPNQNQEANLGRIYLKIENYIDNFEILEKHLLRENILNGSLSKLYETTSKSIKTIDTVFAEQLSNFRLSLANNLLENNSMLINGNLELLSYLTQVIINRVLFIRICEARRVEKDGLLIDFYNSGFWNQFKASSYNDFYEHYDGPLFDRVHNLQEVELSDIVFKELLDLLYYPSPYRFDVIPTKLLSDIYEIFLAKKLTIKNGIVEEELKPEYTKSKGAVSTPQYLVKDLLKRTIVAEKLIENGIDGIFETKILDFACGSGIFLIEIFDYIEEHLIEYYSENPNIRLAHLFFHNGSEITLTIEGKRSIIANCIYGVDIDPEAVEVAKMSLSLKVVDSLDFFESYQEIGIFGRQILNSVGDNIKCGNTLVSNDIMEKYPEIIEDTEQLLKTNAFDWNNIDGFQEVFESKGGFDFIVGNPPYVEVKHYKKDYAFMHTYIKEQYETTSNGKIDLAVAFIERGISLLNENGKLGLIVPKRFFKTNYGKNIRRYISSHQLLSEVIDFECSKIFKNRITYVASMILDKTKPQNISYIKIDSKLEEIPLYLRNLPPFEIESSPFNTIPSEALSETPWNFEDADILSIKTNLLNRYGKFGDFATVRGGVQSLWNRAYHIKVTSINSDGTLTGDTALQKNITIEIDACRPLILNKKFYPYCEDRTDTYVIFPYFIENNKSNPILFDAFNTLYPLAGAYLNKYQQKIIEEVKTFDDDSWHLFTRANSHQRTYPKVMLPMTAMDTFANVTQNPLNYCDNANMFFIDIPDKSENNLYAVAGVINSTLFSILARLIALTQQNGYFKFNKQFIEPIPFPKEIFEQNHSLVIEIANLSKSIQKQQIVYKNSSPRQKKIIGILLNKLWDNLDNKVFELYQLSEDESRFFLKRGRNIDRVEILD